MWRFPLIFLALGIIFVSMTGFTDPVPSLDPDPNRLGSPADCTSSGCHADLAGFEFMHEAAEDDCESCHDETGSQHPEGDGPEYEISDATPDLCYMCHDENNTKKVIHSPVEEGYCSDCHSPHGSDEPFMLVSDGEDSVCLTCHEVTDDEKPFKHGPVASNNCTGCHDPHESDESELLKAPSPLLCFNCHDDKEEEAQFATVHDAFEDDCSNCHEPHDATIENLLFDEVPALCLDCHDDIAGNPEDTVSVHKPFTEAGSCATCHDPHASEEDALLAEAPPELCFNCHRRKAGRSVNAVEAKVTKAEFVHSPVEDGDCAACHQSHVSDLRMLLTEDFPHGRYALGVAETYTLCFDCHDSDMLEVSTSTSATSFRDGSTNLHYLHLNKEKGRTCTSCHDVHGSDNPMLMADEVPFGSWKMPIGFVETRSGGSCSPGCHEEAEYDRAPAKTVAPGQD